MAMTPSIAVLTGLLLGSGEYAPDRDCAVCHRAIYDSYQAVGMARSFYRPRPGNVIEDFENNRVYHGPSKRHYEMVQDDGTFLFRRYQLDEDGRRINELQRKIDWVIGSGHHSRGYLFQTEAGELFELPVVWYTKTRRWGMAPGYDTPDHDGITRPITRECMFCHNAFPQAAPGSDAYGRPHLFPRELPEGTGCQRCHGPGAGHIELANDLDAPLEAVIDSIVNPGRLPPHLRDDVCYQCHLQPSSRLTSLVRRFGRPDYSYRPGERLADYLVHLDFDEGRDRADRFEINHHPYRLRQSTCYRESNGELNCLSCHDPHRKVTAAEAAAHYRDRCLSCHAMDDCRLEAMDPGDAGRAWIPDVPADDCTSCHMPKRRTEDVVHVVMTDHLIQRRIDGDPLAAFRETPPPEGAHVELYFPQRAPPREGGGIYRAISAAADGNVSAIPALEILLAAAGPPDAQPYVELGTAQLRAGRFRDAIETFGEAIDRDPAMALAYANTGVALVRLGHEAEAIAALSKALEIGPPTPDVHFNLGATYARLARGDEAMEHYREAVRLRPHYAKAWLNLGNLLARNGRFREAVEALRRALSAEPNLAAAYRSLGSALRRLGDWPEAVRVWRHGASQAPGHAGIARELALAYLIAPEPSVVEPRQGLRYARAAADADPESHQTATTWALALLLNDRPRDAVTAARRAVGLGADEGTCLLIRALGHEALGETAQARDAYREARRRLEGTLRPDRVRDTLRERADEVFGAR